MKTFLDNVIRVGAQRSRLWLACTAGLALLTFFLSPGQRSGGAIPSQATNAKLISGRSCLPTNIKGTGDRLSPDELARVVAEYLPHKKDDSPSKRIEDVLMLEQNEKLICGDSTTEERQSICFKNGVRTLCLPFESY